MTTSPLQYLDKAMSSLRDLGLVPERTDDAPIIALLDQISDLDEARIVGIARTLNQAATFNEVVREQISAVSIGERYREITNGFDSIREDAKRMVDQVEDGVPVGRSRREAPEIDGMITLDSGRPGELVRAKIVGSFGPDREAQVVR